MLKIKLWILLFTFTTLFISCGEDNPVEPAPAPAPTPTTGTITGTLSLAPGVAVVIGNSRVAIFASFADWQADREIVKTSCDNNGYWVINEVTPGTYYLDAWKDINNDGTINTGDLFGVNGSNGQPSPFSVSAGTTVNFNWQLSIQ